jgi:hypothetical protein
MVLEAETAAAAGLFAAVVKNFDERKILHPANKLTAYPVLTLRGAVAECAEVGRDCWSDG